MLEVFLTGLALGMIHVGKCNDTAGGTIVEQLMEAWDEIMLSTSKHYNGLTINDSLSL